MNLSGYVFLLTILTILAITGVLLFGFITANFRGGHSVRESLSRRIGSLRLKKMLKQQGINFSDYLHKLMVHDMEKQIRACEGCNKTEDCDVALKENRNTKDLRFCPNHESISQIKIKLACIQKI